MSKRDFLSLEDLSDDELEALLALAARVKRGEITGGLERKVLAMVFMDPSLRTRTSFETAMFLHGGHAVVLEPGKGSWALETGQGVVMDGTAVEHIAEAARVLARYADALAVRVFPKGTDWAVEREDRVIRDFTGYSDKPVINLESSRRHPCQGQERSQHHQCQPGIATAETSIILDVVRANDAGNSHYDAKGQQVGDNVCCKIKHHTGSTEHGERDHTDHHIARVRNGRIRQQALDIGLRKRKQIADCHGHGRDDCEDHCPGLSKARECDKEEAG